MRRILMNSAGLGRLQAVWRHFCCAGRRCATPTAIVFIGSVMLASASGAFAQPAPLTRDDMRDFLLTAEVVGAVRTGIGTTQPWRLTLSDGRTEHDAHFQSVDRVEGPRRFGDRFERRFIDSYHYNIAAYRLADLLGLGEMMPVTVERTWDGRRGALAWWIDDVMFDEGTRLERGVRPDDLPAWSAQMANMTLFAELVQDTDRNQGNIIYTLDWRVQMIDFTRAFRPGRELLKPDQLTRCDRGLFERLQALTPDAVKDATGPHLTDAEIDAVIHRRDTIKEHFERLIVRRGEAVVLIN
jgi:hypothetical protein